MKKLFFLLPLFLLADVNPFDVNLSNNNSQYLTPQEKAILDNKQMIQKALKEINELKKENQNLKLRLVKDEEIINNLQDKLQGFNTLVDEVNTIQAKVNQCDINLSKNLEQNLTNLTQQVNTIAKLQEIHSQNIKSLQDSFRLLVTELKQREITPKEAMKEAKSYFFGGKYNKAKELFLYTLSKNYLPATSAYYLGEIAFKEKNYNEALGYYKKSVELYPKKASFTPRLLFHTAVSFEKLGNKTAAQLTLKKIIHDFPKSKYANLAQKELEKLK